MSRPNTTPYELSAQDIQRFHQSYRKNSPDACWTWIATCSPRGYGMFFMNKPFKRQASAARIAYLVFYGIQPKDELACHHCDNPPCVNPNHLFLGDYKDNALDAVAKGRIETGPRKTPRNVGRGERQHLAKLTDEKVLEIRRLNKEEKIGCHRLARQFGVSPANIKYICRGVTWKHLL